MEDLTKTITYYYVKDSIFETNKDRNNFIRYCEYMMFSSYDDPLPISDEDYRDYFRGLYKAIEMRYEEDVLMYENEITCDFDDYYNCENDDENNNDNEDLYLKYEFI
jgi:hypothetical protein